MKFGVGKDTKDSEEWLELYIERDEASEQYEIFAGLKRLGSI